MNACHTSWRLRYSNETSREVWLDAGTRRNLRMRSRRVLYLPLYRKVRKLASAVTPWMVLKASVSLERRRIKELGSS